MTPGPTFSVHLLVVQQDSHVHLTLFMGPGTHSRARCGELVMAKEEFFVLLEALRQHPDVEEVTITYKGTAKNLNEEDDPNDRKGSY